MEHSAALVDILNKNGLVVGQKSRQAIQKEKDIFNAVYTFLVTPRGELVLSIIPPREDLPNLYARQLGVPVGTIRRHGETTLHAARRGLSRELFIDNASVHLLGQEMLHPDDGRSVYATVYYLIGEAPSTYSIIDIDTLAVLTPKQLQALINKHPEEVAPTLRAMWQKYRQKLPI